MAGNILAESLSIASEVIFSKDETSLSQVVESGVVTVIKLGASTSSNVVRINRSDAEGSEVVVLLPETLNDLATGNLMLVVTDLLPAVGKSFPQKKDTDPILLNSNSLLEISFAQEIQGEVSVLEINNLTDPLTFKISDEAPVAGDECVYFDPLADVWSTDGAQLLEADPRGNANRSGSWCAVTHTSIFAIAQSIDFGKALVTERTVKAEGYFVAVLLAFAACCFIVPALCVVVLRRLKAPSVGKAYLTARGRSRAITSSMTKMVSEKEDGQTDGKVLVKWDVTPDVLEDLDSLKLRHGSTELSTKSREVIRVQSLKNNSALERSPRSASSRHSDGTVTSHVSFDTDASVPADRVDHSIVVCSIDDLLPPTPPALPEAYGDGEMVLYWSQSLQQNASAVIVGKGTWSSDEQGEIWPAYDCRVGRHQQLRCRVPLSLLRPAPMVGEKIVVQICGEWFPARFMASFFFLEVARVALAESNHEALDGLSDDLQVPFRCIGRRFSKGQMCRIYRGQDGWVNARIEEDKVDTFDLPSSSVENADVSSPGQVLISLDSEMRRLPLSLVRTSVLEI